MTLFRIAAGVALATLIAGTASAAGSPADTRREGLNLNSFVQQGPVAAHIVLRSGTDPRLIVAFPAGNSGVGLWFMPVGHAADWTMVGAPRPTTLADAQGRPLHGVTFRATIVFHEDGTELTSDSTLRFRTHDEIIESLDAADFRVDDVREAPDRPGKEYVFLAARPR